MRRLGFLGLLFWLTALGAAGQTSGVSVSVRLYSLHPQQYLQLTARTGSLRWRTCDRCIANEASQLSVRASGNKVQVEGGSSVERLFVEGGYRIDPQHGLKIALSAPLQLTARDGLLTVIAAMPLEDYVAAAVEGESASFTHPESLKAMAVAVRTYAARFRPRHASEGFDFCDNTHCQNLNFTGPTAQVQAAVEATRGELLWYQGSPAATYYHQNCGGTLAAGEEVWPTVHAPYLREHTDPYCKQGAPLSWKAEFSRVEFEKALRDQGIIIPAAWTALTVEARGPSGRALKLAFRGGNQPPQLISASTLRFAIGRSFGWNRVRSDLYEVETNSATMVFNGHGAGHGVGLCQAGAEEMAREGKSYRAILDFYYPGTKWGRSAQGLEWQTRASDSFELKSIQPDQDAEVLIAAERALGTLQTELGWKLDFKVQLRVFPTLDTYRDATGQPGWIAAYTRGHIISLQPAGTLKAKSILESTLRHEFTHLLVESRARVDTPLWFREGLVLYLAEPEKAFTPVVMTEREMETALEHPGSQESLRRAYAAAHTRVARLVQQNGRDAVLLWLSSGLPDASRTPQH
jgi:stage II sporulation protein D